jgi:hypothetical protein
VDVLTTVGFASSGPKAALLEYSFGCRLACSAVDEDGSGNYTKKHGNSDMKVTWDPDKEKENIRKHNISFSYAAEVFHDAHRLVWYDAPTAERKTGI